MKKEENKKTQESLSKDIHPYKKDGIFAKIPFSIKALFIKWWFYGCGFFFVFMGLANVFSDGDSAVGPSGRFYLMIILGLFNGVISDIAVYHIIDLMDTDKRQRDIFVLFHNKKVYSLIINVIYSLFITFIIIYFVVEGIGDLFAALFGGPGPLLKDGIGPIFAGLIFLVVDMLFITIKNLIILLVKKIKGENKNV